MIIIYFSQFPQKRAGEIPLVTKINKAAIIIIYNHDINFITFPKIKQGGVFINDEN
jgi:hypothetical protein